MPNQTSRIPKKYTDNTNKNKNDSKNANKKRPNMDDIINEQRAEELQKKLLAEQSEHNLDDVPAELLLESYMISQLQTEEQKESNNNNNNDGNNNNNNKNNMTQEEHDRLLAMQLEFALDEDHELSNIDNIAAVAAATTANNNSSIANRKKAWKGNTNNSRYGNEKKIRIQPNYYFDENDFVNNSNGVNGVHSDDSNNVHDEEEEEEYDDLFNTKSNNNNNNNNSKIRNEPIGSGNKMAISGTANRHRFEEWSEKHVSRLHEYNANLGEESGFKNVRLGNKAYNSFRRDLEKKGFKKCAQPTPVDKK